MKLIGVSVDVLCMSLAVVGLCALCLCIQGTTHRKEWAAFDRAIRNRQKFPSSLSSYASKSKTDLFGAWLDCNGNWDELPG